MNEQNRLRLDRMTARYERERAARGRDDDDEAAYLGEFARVCAGVLRPLMDEIGGTLRRSGHDYRIEEGPARLDFYLTIRGRTGSKDLIQFFVKYDAARGHQVIVELVLKRSPVELSRYAAPAELTPEVAEQLLVDGLEQLLASPAS